MPGRNWLAPIVLLLSIAGAHAADVDLLMGNPSKATADPEKKNNYLMNKEFYALSYNNDDGRPNWVSWHLHQKYLGDAPRKQKFDPDNQLPRGFTRITHKDYTNSGFDRGHMCPHSDRDATKEMSYATFIMTNSVPQSNENNAGAWNQLEMYCRYLVKQKGKELYIVAGPHGMGGEGRNGTEEKLAKGKVSVPSKVWKVILVLDANDDDNDVERVDKNTRLIAVIMPNDRSVPVNNWWKYRVSVKEIEELTGYSFFDKAPKDITEPLKAEVDKIYIQVIPRKR